MANNRMRLAELGCGAMTGRPLSEILDKFAVSDRARALFIEGFAGIGEVLVEKDEDFAALLEEGDRKSNSAEGAQ